MAKRKPQLQYGWRDQGQKQPRECEQCGVPLKTTPDELVLLCGDCSGRAKRRLADKSEVVDRGVARREPPPEWDDAWLRYASGEAD